MLLKKCFENAQKHSFQIIGIDIDNADYDEICEKVISNRLQLIEKNEDYRIKTMTDNLAKLSENREGIVFLCGALHSDNILSKLKEKNSADNTIYYFPHTPKRYEESMDDINDILIPEHPSLKNHTICLSNSKDVELLKNRIIAEIKTKNTIYKKEILGGNAQTLLLNKIFKANFELRIRPGYYVDALLDYTENRENIVKKLHENDIKTKEIIFQDHKFLVIPDINIKEVATKISNLI